MKHRLIIPLVLASLLTACGLDESAVFFPYQHEARLNPADLTIRGEGELGALRHERLALGGDQIAVTTLVPASLDQATLGEAGVGPLIVSCFGNASDRRLNGIDYLRKIAPFGEAVIWDYPGYGDSTGTAEAARFEAVIEDLVLELDRRAGDRPLIFWGHSLGGFVCAQMAVRSQAVDAIILETTAPNVRAVAREWAPLGLGRIVPIDDTLKAFDTPQALAEFDGPILIIGAGRDQVLPVELSRQLAEQLPKATYLELPQVTHFSAGFDPQAQAAVKEIVDGL